MIRRGKTRKWNYDMYKNFFKKSNSSRIRIPMFKKKKKIVTCCYLATSKYIFYFSENYSQFHALMFKSV